MVYVQSPGQQETDEKFGRLWFASLASFHKVRNSHTWDTDNDHVIEFLRSKLSEKMPTWKRLKYRPVRLKWEKPESYLCVLLGEGQFEIYL